MAIAYRETVPQVIRGVVDFDTTDFATGVKLGTMRRDGFILSMRTLILTPFNAGTSNLLDVGFSAGGQHFAINQDLSQAAGTQMTHEDRYRTYVNLPGGDYDVFLTYRQSGAAATAGSLFFVAEWSV